MKRLCLGLLLLSMLGCRMSGMNEAVERQRAAASAELAAEQAQMARERAYDEIGDAISANPDLPAWHEQRERLVLASGDRQFEQGFDRVFDSVTVALATLGCRVWNMERASGYIAGSIPALPPAQIESLNKDAVREYVVAKGYSPEILDPAAHSDQSSIEPGFMFAISNRMAGLTISIVKQGAMTSKVKLRFSDLYYPGSVEAYYRVVWDAVDKQMFLDRGLE